VDCWKLLGVEPNADAKTVKLAYSKLLKKNRPEDDPERFQELHNAYKLALKSVSANASTSEKDPANRVTQYTNTESEEKSVNERSGDSSAILDETTSLDNVKREEEIDGFIADVQSLVEDPEKINIEKEWRELLKSPVIVDLEHRRCASDRIFCFIADANLDREEKSGFINSKVLTYLNNEFKWEENRYDLVYRFGSKRCDAVFDNLDEKMKDWPFLFVGFAGTVVSIIVILSGYFEVSFIPVVLAAAIPSAAKRLYTRQWQEKRYGLTNGGDAAFLGRNRMAYFSLIYLVACLVESFFYGIGWLIRVITS